MSDAEITTPDGERLTVELRRSGVVQWQYESAGPEVLVVLPFLLLWNVVGRVAYRGGWTVWVLDENGRKLLKRRHRSKDGADADSREVADGLVSEGRAALKA